MKIFSVCMRIFPAGFWPNFINRTVIIASQKRTRYLLQHMVIIFIYPKVIFNEFTGLHFKMPGNAFNILIGKKRAGGFTTVCAAKAISLGKLFIMQLHHLYVQMLWWFFAHICKELFILLMLIFGLFREIFQDFFHNAKI